MNMIVKYSSPINKYQLQCGMLFVNAKLTLVQALLRAVGYGISAHDPLPNPGL